MTTRHDSIESERLGAEDRVLSMPPGARADRPLFLRVAVRNTGAAPWPNLGAHPVNLSYHWLGPDGQMVEFDVLSSILPAPLRSGESADLELQDEPPPRAGDYQQALDMV